MKTFVQTDSVDSTQVYAKAHLAEFDLKNLCYVSAKHQTDGRGTRGKSWQTCDGENLHITFIHKLKNHPSKYPNLAQIASLSLVKVLNEEGLSPTLKWPNDLLLSKKKCGGILCELTEDPRCALIGVGLNINATIESLEKIDIPTTSLYVESKQSYNTKSIIDRLTTHLKDDLMMYEAFGFEPFFKFYQQSMPYLGYDVYTEDHYLGKGVNVEPDGSMRVINDNRIYKTISAGSMDLYSKI